jgi:hydrogenase 3 maturation protease
MGADRQLSESLAQWRNARVVILGVGNTLKGDDAVGPFVCERLSGRVSARVIDAGTTPENYIRPILEASPDVLLIVDAIDCGARPGDTRIVPLDQVDRSIFSTHALSLHLSIDLIRRERALEACLIGIQAESVQLGGCLSPAVGDAVDRLVDMLTESFPSAEPKCGLYSPPTTIWRASA